MKLSVDKSNVCFHGYDNSKFWNVAMIENNSIDWAFQQYYRPLCLYALHYLHDLDEAEDVVQDCFVRLLESGKYDALCQQSSELHSLTNQLKSFLYASVRNACIDRLRRKNPVLQDVSPSDLQGLITDEQAIDSSSREAELWTAIEQLPDRCREIFLMSKRDGMTHREIAEELGLSEKTVEHQISKALKILRGRKEELYYVSWFFVL